MPGRDASTPGSDRVLRAVCLGHVMSAIIDVATPPQETIALLKEMTDERRRR